MSKGIGKGYLTRMTRYHKPSNLKFNERVSTICDRSFYHDGAFRYKLPRYFRDRLYRMRGLEQKQKNLRRQNRLPLQEQEYVGASNAG